jgi:hypothetical protein
MRRLALLVFGSLLLLSARHRAIAPPKDTAIDIRRSLVITDRAILDGFDLQRVLQALTDRSGATATTPLSLYRQWFDTQNPKPGLAVADAPHCDDFLTNGKPSFNGFPRRCPTPEGALATSDPFTAHDYTPIGITNRFDLTPTDGANCGQYRIVYAKTTSGLGNRLHIIFEPVLANPTPQLGVVGCRGVAQFWADLSRVESATERRARLERFFFDGVSGFEPVLQAKNFAPTAGRIRTMHETDNPRFYQFHLVESGARLLVVPGLLENQPHGSLFNAAAPTALGAEFRQFFISQVATLAVRDVNGFFNRIPDKYLMTESNPDQIPPAFVSQPPFNTGLTTAEGLAFNGAIIAELSRIGSSLNVRDVLVRTDFQNCHGCHFGSGNIGDTLSFTGGFRGSHIDEEFGALPALVQVFAPNRARILRDFLNGAPLPVHSNGGTLGGGRTSD